MANQNGYRSLEPLFLVRKASLSTISFSSWPAWPLVQRQINSCSLAKDNSSSHKSLFFTSFLLAVFQPLVCQFSSQPSVKAFFKYCESVVKITLQGSLRDCKAFTAALNSIRLFVVAATKAESCFLCPLYFSKKAQAPFPVFVSHDPSV